MPVDTKASNALKARQGVFFIALSLGATSVVLLMLLTVLGYTVYRGWDRLFYSPVYEIKFTDGTTLTTELNQNVEFDIPEGSGKAARNALQAAKSFDNERAEALKYAQAPLPEGTIVEVWIDEVVEEKDPWASPGEEAALVRKTIQKKRESVPAGREVRYDMETQAYSLVLQNGETRQFKRGENLQFKQGDTLVNLRTLVTRYLQAHPEERARREKQIAETIGQSKVHNVDPRWKAYVLAHVEERGPDGTVYEQEQRVKELPAVVSFRILERWNWFQFFWDFPRSGNTEGGILPCIYGTVLMTLIMTLIVAPFGVASAVYLMEYARNNWFTHFVRLSIANLAGVPSIVFGLFGLGFFVLRVGGGIDSAFYGGDKVFGTPCVLWASLTMALLTLPVMIVATEEALRAVPRELREGALALGATKFSTIWTVVIPTALPGILTGVILAVARGAGEVAPLLLTGVVAHKDQLPVNPLEKFMNLAYHIYDLSVKSQPNKIEEAQALAFSATLVLILVVVCMNLAAVLLRARVSRHRAA